MNIKIISIIPLTIMLLSLSGCSGNQAVRGISSAVFAAGGAYGGYRACNGRDKRTKAGCAALGGLAGALVGNFIGSQIVKYMDNSDKRQLNQALKSNRSSSQWKNPKTGTVFHVTDIRSYENCKEFTLNAQRQRSASSSEQHRACKNRNGAYI